MTAKVISVSFKCPYEKVEDTKRPYRIWDSVKKSHTVGRNYSTAEKAHNGALLLVRWGTIGTALEVYDITRGKLIGQYVRKPTSIIFLRG
jgi:hypothetical protein